MKTTRRVIVAPEEAAATTDVQKIRQHMMGDQVVMAMQMTEEHAAAVTANLKVYMEQQKKEWMNQLTVEEDEDEAGQRAHHVGGAVGERGAVWGEEGEADEGVALTKHEAVSHQPVND